MNQKLPKLLLLYLAFFSFLSPALSLYEGSESFIEDNPIPELYTKVNTTYMTKVIDNLKSLLKNYVFSDILQKPIEPYSDIKVDMSQIFDHINTKEDRPFYEFYRDIEIALSESHDANLDIFGGNLLLGDDIISFGYYRQCLPFKFYVDYNDTKEAKLFIKEYETCSKYYDEETKDLIKTHEKIALTEINGTNPFDYLQNFGTEFYRLKNPESRFSLMLDSIHDNYLSFTPLSLETLKPFKLAFADGTSLETRFKITNETIEAKEKIEETNANFNWNYTSEKGEIKCRVDSDNKLNVLYIKKFFIEPTGESTLSKCTALFLGFNHKLIIITSQLWEEENENSFYYLQYLFPKITFKYNMAMKQTDYNRQLFEKDTSKFLDTKTCTKFKSWDNFIENSPDDYGDNIKHNRTKPFYSFGQKTINKYNDLRKELITKGNLKKSTDVLIFTDSVNIGPAGTFIKTIQNNGAAIIASYAGNPYLNKTTIKTLDVGLDPVISTNYENISNEYDELKKLGIEVYKIPYAEAFESANITDEYKYPMAFKVNKVDEMTNIYHLYDDIYYDEFINKAKDIFEKYNEKRECNKNNPNLVYESNYCTFQDDAHAHGGYSCGDDGKWTKACKKSYCNYAYFYDKTTDKCKLDTCITDEIIEINEETEKVIEIKKDKRYIIDINTYLYTYFFKSPVDNIIFYSDYNLCPRFCVVKAKEKNYMYINYYRNLNYSVNVTITSKKMDLQVESFVIKSPHFADIKQMTKIVFILQLEVDNYMYIDSYDKGAKFYFAKYDDNISPDDLINLDKKYFKDGLDQLMFLTKDGIYILAFTPSLAFVKFYFYDALPSTIKLKNGEKTNLFLNKNISYNLDFTNNELPFMIRLNEKTDGKCTINDYSTEAKNITLTDKYFVPSKNPYSGIININDINIEEGEGILIEILYQWPDFEKITKNVTNHKINKFITLVEFNPPETKKKIIKIYIESKNYFGFGLYGGPSKDNFFYYSQGNLPKEGMASTNYLIKLDDPLKDVKKEEKETYYISLILSRTIQSQDIYLTVQYEEDPLEELYEQLDESYAKDVINNLASIVDKYYVYNDIAKNPPKPNGLENYTHPKIDFSQALNNIKTENKKFYDFYREIREILGTSRDIHFGIYALYTPSGSKFYQMTACLPFRFYVDKVGNDSEKVYIKYFSDCAPYFSEKIRKIIQEKEEKKIALEKINDKDPFDYIQEWGLKYLGVKSPHGQFTFMKVVIHSFPLYFFPYNHNELSMEFKFENDTETLNLDYYIYIPNFRTMNNLLGSNNILDEDEFDEFYKNEMKKHFINVPNIFEMIRIYKKSKGILLEEENESPIKWDYQIIENKSYLKCRVDKINKLNIILQNSFDLDYYKTIEVMNNCVTLFHQNNYKIVVIENFNGGGYGYHCVYLHQLLQIKIQSRGPYVAYRLSDYIKEEYEKNPQEHLNSETCKPYYNAEDFLNGTIDDYSDSNGTILHKKTKITEFFSKERKIMIEKMRRKLEQTKNGKNPTDIIVFTDSYSYSATSAFIKGFQNEGGAIIVGYNGNPKKGIELFDASHSPSSVIAFEKTKEYANLYKLGFQVNGITHAETFDEDYKKPNPIPREYKVDIIDERSIILEAYSDDKYQLFMNESQRIFEKYNEKGECNPNNKLLLFNNESCTFSDDEFAHGGNPCGSDGKWNKTKCQKYYCDFGYIYSKIEDKCLRDNCTNDPLNIEIMLNGPYDQEIILNNQSEYILRVNTSEYLYFFEANESGYMHYEINDPCPSSICVLQMNHSNEYNKIHLNYFRNATNKNVKIKINSIQNFPGVIQSKFLSDINTDLIQPLPQKKIFIVESKVDYIIFPRVFDESTKMYCVEYSKEIKVEDIVNINDKYFRIIKNGIFEITPGKIYIFAIKTGNPGTLINIFLQPKLSDKNLFLTEQVSPLTMYLTKDIEEYTIDFTNNKYYRVIHLSKATPDSEINIKNEQAGIDDTLNSKNAYYIFDRTKPYFNSKLSVNVTKGNNAIIEFLFVPTTNYDIISEKEFTEHKITKTTIIKFDKNIKGMHMNIILTSKYQNNFGYSFLTYHSKNNVIPYPVDIESSITNSSNYLLQLYNPRDKLEKDESFSLILYVDKTALANDEILASKIEDVHYPISELYQNVSPEYMKDVISNITSLLDAFAFSDILKNPPEPYDKDKFDIISAFDNITINQSRPFYEFYRDIKTLLSLSRDANLDILGSRVTLTKDTYDFDYYRMCLPFTFYMDNKDNKDIKMYIKEYEFCSKYFDINLINTIKKYENIPLEKINDTDPFDFIYKFSIEFYNLKNRDAQFANMIDVIPDNTLVYQPLTPWQLNYIKLEFNNKELFETNFHVIKTKIEEFNNKKEEFNDNQINWDIKSPNGEIKCRADENNKLNVLFISSLHIEQNIIKQCAEKFYSNNYKILIITSQLWEGDYLNSYIYSQLLFPKLDIKFNLAMRQSELTKQLYESDWHQFLNPNTCFPYNTWDELIESEPDIYGDIKHLRTKIYSSISEETVINLNEIRKSLKNLKKSTEILILTDTVNMGAASLFIKSIQSNGGAIIASYGGNPKLDKTKIEQLDASLDPTYNSLFEKSEQAKNLKNHGFITYIPYVEAFESANITGEYKYPMAFKVNKVDEITNIYNFYDDIYYDEFINKTKEIFEKYNEKQECNKNNPNLVYENDECKFEEDVYAHGGYSCDNNGNWNNETCKISYCDIGYYYDKTINKCVVDSCINRTETEIILNNSYDKEIIIENNTRYVLKIDTKEYIYFFEANESGYMHYDVSNPCPSSICVLQQDGYNHNNRIYLNYFQGTPEKGIKIKISSSKDFSGLIESILLTNQNYQLTEKLQKKMIFIFESKVDYIYYAKSFQNKFKIYSAEYNKDITPDDIVNINKEKFKQEDKQILESPPNKTYIIAITTEETEDIIELMTIPIIGEKDISISDNNSPRLIYFSKNISEYTLDFKENKYERMIKLSKSISNSEITIKNIRTGNEKTLSTNNPYYIFENTNAAFNGKLSVKVKNGDNAMIEFLFNPSTNYEIKKEKEINEQKLTKPVIINFDQNTKDININITLSSKNKTNFDYSYFTYYSKDNYIPYTPDTKIPLTISDKNEYFFQIYNKKENNDEVLGLLIYIDPSILSKSDILLSKKEDIKKVDPTDIPTDTDKKEEDDNGLPGWAIALIVLGAIIVAVVIAIIVWKFVVSKNRVNAELIGPLTNEFKGNENEINEDK